MCLRVRRGWRGVDAVVVGVDIAGVTSIGLDVCFPAGEVSCSAFVVVSVVADVVELVIGVARVVEVTGQSVLISRN